MPDEGGNKGLKYSQWRPIGVCDQGQGNQRKARIFTKIDFTAVTTPGINRRNWHNRTEVVKIVNRYARQVAKLSLLTKTMKSPKIGQINLVGAVLGHEKTPGLNVESADGRVQFFQVEFYDADADKKRKSIKPRLYWIISGLVFAILVFFIFWNYFPSISEQSRPGRNTARLCENRGKPLRHRDEMRRLRRDLLDELDRYPGWSQLQEVRWICAGVAGSLEEQEQLLVRCLLNAKRETQSLATRAHPDLRLIEKCANNLCRSGASYLSPFCRQL